MRRRCGVLILGCGPAGLFAAQAAKNAGVEYAIFSKRRKSELFGAQYLQAPIPGLVDWDSQFKVHFSLNGTFLDYKSKVYGEQLPDPDAVSEDGFFVAKPAWDIRAAYDAAWETHEHAIHDEKLDAATLADLRKTLRPKLTVSTIPLPAICANSGHAFTSQSLWAVGDAPERGQFVDWMDMPDNTIRYDGTPDTGWHRAARIAGYTTVEWPEANRPPLSDVAAISKPVATSCTCYSSRDFLRVGRYGDWNWMGQSHHGYVVTESWLS